jgi:hypothetical protein
MSAPVMTATAEKIEPAPIRLDIGCGPNKKGPDWTGLDVLDFPGVDHKIHAGRDRWPFDDGTVEEAHASHFLEHLTNLNEAWERVHFFNELHRVLKVGAKATLIFPHWASTRYYGDPTHKEPFSEMGFYYLSKSWRDTQAPHTDKSHNPNGYACDFEATWGYAPHPALMARNAEYQQFAFANYKEAIQDIIATLVKK